MRSVGGSVPGEELSKPKSTRKRSALMSMSKILSLGALALVFAFAPAQAAPATSATDLAGISKAASSDLTQVHYRRGWRGGRGWGPGPWLGLGGRRRHPAASLPTRPIARAAATTMTTTPHDGPTTIRQATRAIRAWSAPRTSAPSSGARDFTRPTPARSGSAPSWVQVFRLPSSSLSRGLQPIGCGPRRISGTAWLCLRGYGHARRGSPITRSPLT